jgi:hypothetical protein
MNVAGAMIPIATRTSFVIGPTVVERVTAFRPLGWTVVRVQLPEL